jgi:glycerol-3-phosphate responsive antiterminator
LIAKYLSALLLVPPKCENIIQLIEADIIAQKLARKDEEMERALRAGGRLSSDEGLAK